MAESSSNSLSLTVIHLILVALRGLLFRFWIPRYSTSSESEQAELNERCKRTHLGCQ